MDISVIMATYNGNRFIKEQIDSIVPYMGENDEFIISDDGSSDGTFDIISEYAKRDSRISVVHGPCKGVIHNFESLLAKASKDIIMFSDQDDIWSPKKLPIIRALYEDNKDLKLVVHSMFICTNEQIEKEFKGETYDVTKKKHGVLRNLLFSCYYGCCMSLSKELRDKVLPFPKSVNAYDQYVGLWAEHCYRGKILFIEDKLHTRRIHGKNMTQRQPYIKRILFRFNLFHSFVEKILQNL